jgi:glycosyltransferase involved in cell wall biosynthesis
LKKPFATIVIPLYNKRDYVGQCIESLLMQTLPDIEIICVDDKSTDDSISVVEGYIKQDKRVRLIRHDRNMGELKSRSSGVMAASGRYIMFLDADDEYELNACESLRQITKEHTADIYGFGTKVICSDDDIIKMMQVHFRMYCGYLYGKDILNKSFVEAVTSWFIWDKMYDSVLCKKVYEIIGDDHIDLPMSPVAPDGYAFSAIAYYAKSFFGVQEPYYRYHFGRGIMTNEKLSMECFERYCMSAITTENCRKFFADRGEANRYAEITNAFHTTMLNKCIDVWKTQISKHDMTEALKLLMHYWPHYEIIEQFARLVSGNASKTWEAPFSMLPKGGSIVLYGAGAVGKDYYRQITDSGVCDIALWVDRGYQDYKNSGLPVNMPETIAGTEFDCILIAIQDNEAASGIKKYLIDSLHVPTDKIVWKDPNLPIDEDVLI